jgi:uncharacterized protein YecE (DUF72 family)
MAASQDERTRSIKAHVGTMGWSYKFWIGNFYPPGTKSSAFLREYVKHFDTVELDNTFYRIPSGKTTRIWREQSSENFLFSAKFPRIITHVKMLRSCEAELKAFMSKMAQLKDKLGPLLLQFPSSFGQRQLPLLQDFLPALPKKYRYAVEVRNKSLIGQKLRYFLKTNSVAQVLVTQPILQEQLTADFVYIRLEGDRSRTKGTLGRVEVDRSEDTVKWASQIRELLRHKTEVFAYFSKYYSGFPPRDAMQVIKYLQS